VIFEKRICCRPGYLSRQGCTCLKRIQPRKGQARNPIDTRLRGVEKGKIITIKLFQPNEVFRNSKGKDILIGQADGVSPPAHPLAIHPGLDLEGPDVTGDFLNRSMIYVDDPSARGHRPS
jgi:hypothetical protein